MKPAYLCLSVIFWLLATRSYATNVSTSDSTTSYVELVGLATSIQRTPFWMHANQYGTVPRSGSMLSARAGFNSNWNLTQNNTSSYRWRASFGVEAVGNIMRVTSTPKPQVLLPQSIRKLTPQQLGAIGGQKKAAGWIG